VKTRTILGALAVLLVAGLSAPAQQSKKGKAKAKEESNPINEKVVEFARAKLGEQVGNGECWTLAHEAVKSAGARSSPAYPDNPNKGDYVWGTLEYAAEARDGKTTETGAAAKVRPGDVVQIRDAKFAGRRPTGGTYTMSFGHHTAIVQTVSPDGRTVGVLHQNYAGKKTVTETTLNLADLQGGWLRFYQPLPR
jgi:hypothetical protein